MIPGDTTSVDEAVNENETQEQLTEKLWYYPQNIILGKTFTENLYTTSEGDEFSLDSLKGEITVITYWASWCQYCEKQLELIKSVQNNLDSYGIRYLLVDKLDGEKETIEQAETYLKENGITIPTVYDKELTIYNELGICIVPTTFILNEDGELVYCYAGVIESEEQLKSMINYAKEGAASDTESFVTSNLISPEGGVYTNYEDREGDVPIGHDVLSESQGLLMEYAAETENKELFSSVFDFVEQYLYRNHLALWVYSEENEQNSNALLDDLRILKALNLMNQKTGGYEEDQQELAQAIVLYNVEKNHPVDFYDFSTESKASRFTLCYGDLAALKIVEDAVPHMEGIADTTLELIEDGYISDEFPFYYNYYDYNKNTYDEGSLNMAEAMYTLYHLSEVNAIRQESIDWIKKRLEGDGIWARYDVNGEVVTGYEYQSSAIYALVGLIAVELNDQQLLTQAVSRMEEYRCFDTGSQLNGAFAQDLSGVMSYDQCLGLLLYGKMQEE